MKIFARLKVFEHVLTLLAAVLVQHINRQPLQIKIDAVAEEQHQHRGHEDHNNQAARIAHNLQDLFAGHGQQASQFHGLRSSASRPVVSETKTSSRLGRIFFMRLTAVLRSSKNFCSSGTAVAASSTTRCSAFPKTAASITPGADCSASTASPSGAHSTRSSSPFIESRFNSVGVPRATILPRKISARRLQYSASSM